MKISKKYFMQYYLKATYHWRNRKMASHHGPTKPRPVHELQWHGAPHHVHAAMSPVDFIFHPFEIFLKSNDPSSIMNVLKWHHLPSQQL